MRHGSKGTCWWVGLLVIGLVGLGVTLAPAEAATPARMRVNYHRLPLSFEANHGQTAPEVTFVARGQGYTVFLTPTEAVLVLRQAQPAATAALPAAGPGAPAAAQSADAVVLPQVGPEAQALAASADRDHASSRAPTVLRMRPLGASPPTRIEGQQPLPGTVNYFTGNDPSAWRTNVPTYARVRYTDVYPGIDLVYYGTQGQLEYDFVVAPRVDPGRIRLAFEGAEALTVDADGTLVLTVPGGALRLPAPHVYQEYDGARQAGAGRYVLLPPAPAADHAGSARRPTPTVGFVVASWDRGKPLVIDPVLQYATYLGGSDGDYGTGIAVDTAGNAYVTGWTGSADFPTANPLQPIFGGGSADAFVAQLDADGNALRYATYLGGSHGERGEGITVDTNGNAYVTGGTESWDFPTVNPVQPRSSRSW